MLEETGNSSFNIKCSKVLKYSACERITPRVHILLLHVCCVVLKNRATCEGTEMCVRSYGPNAVRGPQIVFPNVEQTGCHLQLI
jgi:hypothetical protein